LTIDARKVNTREHGWRDLKIAVVQKRPPAEPATPAQWQSQELPRATARPMLADIAAAKRFRRSWWTRLRGLGLPAMAHLHVLGDGASWIWKSAGLALTGCRQMLDIYCSSQHIAVAGKRLFDEGTAAATAFHEHGRELLLKEGWNWVCWLIGEELTREDTPRRWAGSDRMLNYFVAHLKRLDYRVRLARDEAIGSGVMEGAAKTLSLRIEGAGGSLEAEERLFEGGSDLLPSDRPMGTVLGPGGPSLKIRRAHPIFPSARQLVRNERDLAQDRKESF
jgi:hypothetical protein